MHQNEWFRCYLTALPGVRSLAEIGERVTPAERCRTTPLSDALGISGMITEVHTGLSVEEPSATEALLRLTTGVPEPLDSLYTWLRRVWAALPDSPFLHGKTIGPQFRALCDLIDDPPEPPTARQVRPLTAEEQGYLNKILCQAPVWASSGVVAGGYVRDRIKERPQRPKDCDLFISPAIEVPQRPVLEDTLRRTYNIETSGPVPLQITQPKSGDVRTWILGFDSEVNQTWIEGGIIYTYTEPGNQDTYTYNIGSDPLKWLARALKFQAAGFTVRPVDITIAHWLAAHERAPAGFDPPHFHLTDPASADS